MTTLRRPAAAAAAEWQWPRIVGSAKANSRRQSARVSFELAPHSLESGKKTSIGSPTTDKNCGARPRADRLPLER